MEANLKKIIENISSVSTREIAEDHIKDIIIDSEAKSVTIVIDRKYALNQLISNENIDNVLKSVKKAFSEDYETIIKLKDHKHGRYGNEHHDREMNIPHTIHFS